MCSLQNPTHRGPPDAQLVGDDTLPQGLSKRLAGLPKSGRGNAPGLRLEQLMWALKFDDACIEGSAKFADYCAQLVSWDEYTQIVPAYCEQLSLPIAAGAFVVKLRDGSVR
jgi:hypothetical protein